jgi:hypothetical protein
MELDFGYSRGHLVMSLDRALNAIWFLNRADRTFV